METMHLTYWSESKIKVCEQETLMDGNRYIQVFTMDMEKAKTLVALTPKEALQLASLLIQAAEAQEGE